MNKKFLRVEIQQKCFAIECCVSPRINSRQQSIRWNENVKQELAVFRVVASAS